MITFHFLNNYLLADSEVLAFVFAGKFQNEILELTNQSARYIDYKHKPCNDDGLSSVSKRVSMQNHSYENVFPLEVNFHANQTYVHVKDFARRLDLKQIQFPSFGAVWHFFDDKISN